MSYENLASTKLLATNCAVCARALRDAVSVEMGIGPDCREKYGYNSAVNDTNRHMANKLIFEIADKQTGVNVVEATRQLRNLGFVSLAEKIAIRLFNVRIVAEGGDLLVYTPYTESAKTVFRTLPGRRWDSVKCANRVPVANKNQVWAALKRLFPGTTMLGPDGQFIEIPRRAA